MGKKRYRTAGGRKRGAEPPSTRGKGGLCFDISGVNAVQAAIDAKCEVDRIFVEHGAGHRVAALVESARGAGIEVASSARRQARVGDEARSQGVTASVRFRYADYDEVLAEDPKLVVFLDGIEDPHNLGAVIRTAEAAGADAVVIPQRRSAKITDTVARASVGALFLVPVAVVVNLNRAMEAAQARGLWLVGLDHEAERDLSPEAVDRALGLVVGAEGRGLRRLVAANCDELGRLPMVGQVESLNASVAAALAIYRLCEQRLYKS